MNFHKFNISLLNLDYLEGIKNLMYYAIGHDMRTEKQALLLSKIPRLYSNSNKLSLKYLY